MSRFVVQHHAVLGSTMDEVRAQASEGAPDGTVVVAGRQTQGRGRQGRAWISPEGNLYASILLRPDVAAVRLSELGFIAALAVADAVDAVLKGDRAKLKWPNDVLVDGAKVAGILVEVVAENAAIVGIGVNVAQAPEASAYPVVCLCDAGAVTGAGAVLAQLLAALERHLAQWIEHGFAPLRRAWLARGPAPGDLVRVRIGGHVEAGRFAGLDADGALLVSADGRFRRVIAGEIVAA
jgi:BirA family transcriptional regulator, biotin operon repressor / biotin---[acetyl-CoA-carboxylase] ligase